MLNNDVLAQLDNPAWYALTSAQQHFAVGGPFVKRYQKGILPFAAYAPGKADLIEELRHWLQPNEIFYIIGELPPLPAGMTLLKELPCLQMVVEAPIQLATPAPPIVPLTLLHSAHLFNLIQKVQPGYYEPDTWQLGNYYGIWHNDELVAVAGERMRLDSLTEVSAICTHPDYTGRKYAQYLTAHVCNENFAQGKTPFLHVLSTNERAIRLYEYLGFVTRREIGIWQVQLIS